MEEKERIDIFIKNMYTIYLEKNFDIFLNKCLNYNIKIGDYKKNINQISKNIFYKIIAQIPENKAKIEYKELKLSYFLCVKKIDSNNINDNAIIDVPVYEENYEKIAINLTTFLINNNIDFNIRLYKILKNSYFQIKLYSCFDIEKITKHFFVDQEISKEIKSRVIPFLYQKNLLGIYTEIKPYSFKNFYIKKLYEFYATIDSSEEAKLSNFYKYVFQDYKSESNINKKRMYLILIDYLNIIINNDNIEKLFQKNVIMSLGSYDPNDYNLKLDENKSIYYINKMDESTIKYGNEDFLNLSYSKYYENIIKKDKSDKYYTLFYNIYSELLSENYKNLNNILSLINDDMDIINKQLIIISSAYFAYKKLNIPLKNIYKILDEILYFVLNNVEIKENKNNSLYIINDEYGNKIVNLKDGSMISVGDYIKKHNIINNIPNNSIVHLNSGEIITGKEFIDNIYKYVDKYDSYNMLIENLISFIEY